MTLAYKEFVWPQSPEAETLRRRKKLRFRDSRVQGVHVAAESRGGDSAEKTRRKRLRFRDPRAQGVRVAAESRGGDSAEKKETKVP